MRVLMQGRPDLLERPGGDTVQAVQTAKCLRELGVEVEFCGERSPNLSGYDLVHLFNSTGVTHIRAQLANAHSRGKPVVLSTIYWNQDELLRARLEFGKGKWLGRLAGKDLGGFIRQRMWYAQPEWHELCSLVREADMLLPNSRAESELLYRDFGIGRQKPVQVVVNGVDPSGLVDQSPGPFVERFGVQDFILSVGRIEIRKNQLALLKVLRKDDPPVVFVGAPNGLEPEYAERVRALARERNVRIIDQWPHGEIGCAYAAARIHVLPSWYETPGLGSLEAAVAGCPIVTTDRGCTREYFGEWAQYCSPADPRSLRDAMDKALSQPRTDDLKNRILASFTWARAAEQTRQAYRAMIS